MAVDMVRYGEGRAVLKFDDLDEQTNGVANGDSASHYFNLYFGKRLMLSTRGLFVLLLPS